MHRGIPPCYGGVLALGVVTSGRGYYDVPLSDVLHDIATHAAAKSLRNNEHSTRGTATADIHCCYRTCAGSAGAVDLEGVSGLCLKFARGGNTRFAMYDAFTTAHCGPACLHACINLILLAQHSALRGYVI
jgi:hypothetical protein